MRRALVAAFCLLVGCTHGSPRSAPAPSSSPTATTASPSPTPATYGGNDIVWPRLERATPAPPALGAVRTTARVTTAQGGALPAGLSLPRVGGTATAPLVMTPCGNEVTLRHGGFDVTAPRTDRERLVVLDPGHGGQDSGAVAPDGIHEATRVLQIATLVGDDLRASGIRVVFTRDADRDGSLEYRVALADRLRASLAVSIHLNASPDGPSDHPGTSTFGPLSDPNGRRAAGVLFQAERRYLDTIALDGTWVANRDAGALYRRGSRGDYYYQLRHSHVPWVISESLYITNPPEARLIARDDIRRGLAHAIANGIREYLNPVEPGSGWRAPLPRKSGPASTTPCDDPSA